MSKPRRPQKRSGGRPGGGGRSGGSARGGRGGGSDGKGRSGGGQRRPTGLGGDRVEGRQAVRELLVAGRRKVREVVVSTDRKDAPVLDDILTLAQQLHVPVRELGRAKLNSLARTETHQGVIATAAPLAEADLDDLLAGSGSRPGLPFLLAADGVTDPGNLGALLRTAECAGVTGVVLPRHRAVHVSPAVTKAAAGAVEYLDFALVGGLPAALQSASAAGVVTIGLDMDGSVGVHELPPVDTAVLVVVGSEGRGLSRLVRQRCDVVASIPLVGSTESLNVSVAGAIAMYEIVRRRNHGT